MQSKRFHCERQQKGSRKNESKGVLFSFWQMQEDATPRKDTDHEVSFYWHKWSVIKMCLQETHTMECAARNFVKIKH